MMGFFSILQVLTFCPFHGNLLNLMLPIHIQISKSLKIWDLFYSPPSSHDKAGLWRMGVLNYNCSTWQRILWMVWREAKEYLSICCRHFWFTASLLGTNLCYEFQFWGLIDHRLTAILLPVGVSSSQSNCLCFRNFVISSKSNHFSHEPQTTWSTPVTERTN